MEKLKAFRRLEGLFLSYTPVGDVGLKAVSVMHHLRELSLDETRVTDLGLRDLAGLRRLQELTLRQPASATADWSHSRRLRGCWLDLAATMVTDAGLEHLKGLTGLNIWRLVGPRQPTMA